MQITTIDFETAAIVNGSPIPPKPVGIALKYGDGRSKYWSWGHPAINNCKRSEAKKQLIEYMNASDAIVFHNAKFDLSVMSHWLNVDVPPACEIFDTMIMAFLCNPHEKSLGLKQLADKLLDMPPLEQDELRDWVIKHVPKANDKSWGAHIAQAPGSLVGMYATGDVDRTYLLFKQYHDILTKDAEGLAS